MIVFESAKGPKTRGTRSRSAKRVDIVSLKLVRESSLLYPGRQIENPRNAAQLLSGFLEDSDREKMVVVCLDTKNQPTSISEVSVGSLNSTIVHPREAYKVSVLSNSAAIILAHCHPSGIPDPSEEDIEVTKRLVEAGKVLGIQVLDHIIVGKNGAYKSLREEGLI